MLVASVVAWRREAHGAAGRPRSGLEAGPGAAQTRQSAPRAHEIVAATILEAEEASDLTPDRERDEHADGDQDDDDEPETQPCTTPGTGSLAARAATGALLPKRRPAPKGTSHM